MRDVLPRVVKGQVLEKFVEVDHQIALGQRGQHNIVQMAEEVWRESAQQSHEEVIFSRLFDDSLMEDVRGDRAFARHCF